MRYIICVVILAFLIAKLVSAGESEHEKMMEEIREKERILEESLGSAIPEEPVDDDTMHL